MTTGERIKMLRKQKGLSQEELGKMIGVQKAAVNKYEKGTVVNLKRATIIAIAKALEVSPSYLLGWNHDPDDMDYAVLEQYPDFVPGKNYIPTAEQVAAFERAHIKPHCIPIEDSESDLPPNLLPIRTRKVPILGGIAAGEPIYAQEEHEEYADVDEDTPCDYALRVEGDSMEPTICLGDLVFIRRQPDVNDGQIAAVLIEDSATLKRIFHQSGSLTLISDNAAKYPPRHITCEDGEIRIMGRAVSFKRFLK